MATINAFEMIAALPEDCRPQAMSNILVNNPLFWEELRAPGDPELFALYPKRPPALAVERKTSENPAPYHEIVTTPARDGKRATRRIHYKLGEVYRWLNGEIKGGRKSSVVTAP